jgi:hypothetical protein
MGTGTPLRRIFKAVLLVAAGAAGGGAAFAVASVPDGNGVVRACLSTQPGSGLPATTSSNVRIIDSAHQSCNPTPAAGAAGGETAIAWGVTGPQGPPGTPGAQGPAGTPGRSATVAAGHTLTLAGGQVVTVGGSLGGTTIASPTINPRGRGVGQANLTGSGIPAFTVLGVSFASGAGGARTGAGKTAVHDISITKTVDKASPKLFQACTSGKHFPTVKITLRKAGGKPYLTYKLTDVLVSSYQFAKAGGSTIPEEHISLNFTKLEISYKTS